MINDPHAILLGLYRESEFTETLESKLNFIKKSLRILEKNYILKEFKIDGNHIWHLYEEDSEIPISRDKILELYTKANFLRQSKL